MSKNLRHQLAGLDAADVAHHLPPVPAAFTGGDRALERSRPSLLMTFSDNPHLDADHHVRIHGHCFRAESTSRSRWWGVRQSEKL